MLQSSRGVFFSEGAEAQQAAATQPQKALEALKWTNIHKAHTRYMLQKIPGCVFSEGAEVPQAAATQTQTAVGA